MPASGSPLDPATCRFGGALSGTRGPLACGAPGTAGNPSLRGPLGPAIPRGRPPGGGPRGPTSVLAFVALSDGVRDHPADVEGGHVLLRQSEGLLVRHAALLERLVDVRHCGPELRGRVLTVDRVREAVQQRGDLLRESLEELFHFVCIHHSVFFLTHFVHRPGLSPHEAGPGTCRRRALVTTCRPLPRPPGTSAFGSLAWPRRLPAAPRTRGPPARSAGSPTRPS